MGEKFILGFQPKAWPSLLTTRSIEHDVVDENDHLAADLSLTATNVFPVRVSVGDHPRGHLAPRVAVGLGVEGEDGQYVFQALRLLLCGEPTLLKDRDRLALEIWTLLRGRRDELTGVALEENIFDEILAKDPLLHNNFTLKSKVLTLTKVTARQLKRSKSCQNQLQLLL